jgi:hypothetical protein
MAEKSELLNEQDQVEIPDYSDTEREYLNKLQQRLTEAKTLRDGISVEFDGMSLQDYWNDNENWANTFIKPKENKGDITYASGNVRKKMMAILSYLQGFNLSPDIVAFDENQIKISALGNALEDIIEKTYELENDEEKKLLRQYELLKHGTVFYEDVWNEFESIEKELKNKNYSGKFRGVSWINKKIQETEAVHNYIPLTAVFLGDITQYFITKQPFLFTVQEIGYEEAKAIYGGFEMWQFVSRNKVTFSGDSNMAMINNAWRLTDVQKDRVEVIKYSNKPNKEFQIILNGVPMLPIGFPFPWGHNEYNICQQNFEPIRENFAYGRSFVATIKANVGLFDEMVKLALLKDQKSYKPPMINISGQVVSSRAMDAGKINTGIAPGTLVPLLPYEISGVSNSEFAMIDFVKRNVDENSVSQTFTGQGEKGDPTATQIMQQQQQAKIMMNLVVFSPALLEKKLADLRLMSVLKNWFDPMDTKLDEARQAIRNQYRIVSRPKMIEGEGMGQRFTMSSEENVSSEQIRDEEKRLKTQLGYPVRLAVINPQELKQAKYLWYVNVIAKQKKTSEINKLMFGQMIQEGMAIGLTFNPDYISQEFAEVWEKDPAKLFSQAPPTPQPVAGQNQPQPVNKPVVQGRVQQPTPAMATQ